MTRDDSLISYRLKIMNNSYQDACEIGVFKHKGVVLT
jgi:hypothetical protein